MQRRLIAHVDMDCFFAACEMKRDPALKGIPLIIGAPKDASRGVVCTASYEARKFGVHSAMPISQAVRLCPGGTYLRPDHRYYSAESRAIMEVLRSITDEGVPQAWTRNTAEQPRFEQVSIDEANLDISHLQDDPRFRTPLDIGRYIRSRIREQTGYSCSVGVAPSRIVAKIAAGYRKPHGVTAVYNMKNFLSPMRIDKIPGIGKKTAPYYESKGIRTIGDLAGKDRFFVLDHFGKWGFHHWLIANGQDEGGISPAEEDKSYSREETYMEDLHTAVSVLDGVEALAREVHGDLRDCLFQTVSIKVRYSDFTTITRSVTLRFSTASAPHLVSAALQLARTEIDFRRPIRLLGVRISGLEHTSARQLSLFDFSESVCGSRDPGLAGPLPASASFQLQNPSAPKMM